jgi:hypothetical protein
VIIWSHTLQVAPCYRRRATKRWVSLMTGVVQILQVAPNFMTIIATQTLKVAPCYRRRATKQWGSIRLGTSIVRIPPKSSKSLLALAGERPSSGDPSDRGPASCEFPPKRSKSLLALAGERPSGGDTSVWGLASCEFPPKRSAITVLIGFLVGPQ